MIKHQNLFLVDGDVRRRAAITHCLGQSPLHVEPFEDIAELISRWPHQGVLLIHDGADAIAKAIGAMEGTGEWLPIIAFAEELILPRITDAIMQGAVDYLAWPFSEFELTESAIEVVRRAESVAGGKLRQAIARSKVQRLTIREREVLAGVAGGLSNRLIGEKLQISPRTVEIHRSNLLSKMGAVHSSEAIRIAVEAAIVG